MCLSVVFQITMNCYEFFKDITSEDIPLVNSLYLKPVRMMKLAENWQFQMVFKPICYYYYQNNNNSKLNYNLSVFLPLYCSND